MLATWKTKYQDWAIAWNQFKRIPAKSEVFHEIFPHAPSVHDNRRHLDETVGWLKCAQDATGNDGVARAYSLYEGWQRAYPETTGYIIPTFFEYARFTGDSDYVQRAIRMADWEEKIQMENGAVQGGMYGDPPKSVVFNTGQVIFGWLAAFAQTQAEKYLAAARRAAEYLAWSQSPDGAWRNYDTGYARNGVAIYNTRTAWALAIVAKIAGQDKYSEAAAHNIRFALTQQLENGWFANNDLVDHDKPLLHTIAYATQGILEAAILLDENGWFEAARCTADALYALQQREGNLYGRYDRQWRPTVSWQCPTGVAQTAIMWLRLYQKTAEVKYLHAAKSLNASIKRLQPLHSINPGIRGGIKGAHPIYGGYGRFLYLNWAAKFFADALLLEENMCQKNLLHEPISG